MFERKRKVALEVFDRLYFEFKAMYLVLRRSWQYLIIAAHIRFILLLIFSGVFWDQVSVCALFTRMNMRWGKGSGT